MKVKREKHTKWEKINFLLNENGIKINKLNKLMCVSEAVGFNKNK